jgi:hypothetical protein
MASLDFKTSPPELPSAAGFEDAIPFGFMKAVREYRGEIPSILMNPRQNEKPKHRTYLARP